MVSHAEWKRSRDRKVAEGIAEDPERERRRKERDLAWDLGQIIYDRRTALGLSQTVLARRAGMSQPQLSKMELGGTVPTLPLLGRLALALEAALTMELSGDTWTVEFRPFTEESAVDASESQSRPPEVRVAAQG
ncbi:helix-turn-helix domain-containing protein [Streptomyces sp. NBC_00237]|uniref:helix-turn-helix domain-containing protein n=1 Tax=Streptomyces sp. NBC_00237 TaxID=2975687 RepID=UPI002257AD66|nr:helix-turn-helix domain-containing protein [Streptomyces sp. NBC_00237]MCX5201122.1 helix-turn-helix domain-containing protein [Streptomyces sp. NBC_00237]